MKGGRRGYGYYAFDLDGSLARHLPGVDSTDTIGEPIPAMVELAKRYLAIGENVRIVTARVCSDALDGLTQTEMIKRWCLQHLGEIVPVQAEKTFGMICLYDDRAVGLCPNEGVTHVQKVLAKVEEIILHGDEEHRAWLRARLAEVHEWAADEGMA